MAIGPFEVGYPVDFRSGGDTNKEAFSKHIQEIQRIYGYLNALNIDKISGNDIEERFIEFDELLDEHIDSSNPHPNYSPSFSDITGNLDFSRVTGNVPASRVNGALSNANISANNVNGLTAFVNDLIPTSTAVGDGIINQSLNANGYVKFNNGLIIQWGHTNIANANLQSSAITENYPIAFPNECIWSIWRGSSNINGVGANKSYITFYFHTESSSDGTSIGSGVYLVIGY